MMQSDRSGSISLEESLMSNLSAELLPQKFAPRSA